MPCFRASMCRGLLSSATCTGPPGPLSPESAVCSLQHWGAQKLICYKLSKAVTVSDQLLQAASSMKGGLHGSSDSSEPWHSYTGFSSGTEASNERCLSGTGS